MVCNLWFVISLLLLTSCESPHLDAAREDFYLGRLKESEDCLSKLPSRDKDKVLFLMERGMIRQQFHQFKASAEDWLSAEHLATALEYVSVSGEAAGFVVNDRTTAFRGELYERVLLHAFAAKSYMALSLWDDAAVEARNIIDKLENRNGYPDNAYARYMAGLCMEMIFDYDAASRQYKEAGNLCKTCHIDSAGKLTPLSSSKRTDERSSLPAELVCFVLIGRSPTEYGNDSSIWRWGNSPYAEIYKNGQLLGRSYELANIPDLLRSTEKRHSALRAVRTATRIALKEAATVVVSDRDEFLGSLLGMLLFSTETSGPRRWETLPRWLHVARVPCPIQLSSFDVKFHGRNGAVLEQQTVRIPITNRNQIYVSFCRNTGK